ncbi:ATP-dependent DNA helicase PIF1 [Colletotrichum spinosum]|uniref:ATP-dependent DNA helicase PIF1 n=1 Tax=Colletotrichum spinosum TaxID=1347390 RepID=A0A4R8QEY7_9PEZI|nr:ATP-dependent DNA helicase PIF1 [Colletotrichum spinosum]
MGKRPYSGTSYGYGPSKRSAYAPSSHGHSAAQMQDPAQWVEGKLEEWSVGIDRNLHGGKRKKKKVYWVVFRGRRTGIFTDRYDESRLGSNAIHGSAHDWEELVDLFRSRLTPIAREEIRKQRPQQPQEQVQAPSASWTPRATPPPVPESSKTAYETNLSHGDRSPRDYGSIKQEDSGYGSMAGHEPVRQPAHQPAHQPALQTTYELDPGHGDEPGAAVEDRNIDAIKEEMIEEEIKLECPEAGYVLCEEQKEALDLALKGNNLFITGSGGCGKSVLVKALLKGLRAQDKPGVSGGGPNQDEQGEMAAGPRGSSKKNVHLMAPTGQAALNIDGTTTWTFAGWKPDDIKLPVVANSNTASSTRSHRLSIVDKTKARRDTWLRLVRADVLIIDEISMVENKFFTRLSEVITNIRHDAAKNKKYEYLNLDVEATKGAFGGIQVIVVGDFCQLPPIMPFLHCGVCGQNTVTSFTKNVQPKRCQKGPWECPEKGHDAKYHDRDKWAFKSAEWEKCNFKYVHLTQIHRQSDQHFIEILQKGRMGLGLEDGDAQLLLNHETSVENGVKLFGRKGDVESCNKEEFDKLQTGRVHQYLSLDVFKKAEPCDLSQSVIAEYEASSFDTSTACAVHPWHTKHLKSRRPLNVLQEHRYQATLELKDGMPVVLIANIDIEAGLCNGSQGIICGFVNASEAEQPKEPVRQNYKKDKPGFDLAMERYERISEFLSADEKTTKSSVQFPRVVFPNSKGGSYIIGPHCTVSEIGGGHPYNLLSRTQVPLVPGWAMTIHKSQSLSMDRVIVDLSHVWESGQAYVALSRAKSLQGLEIRGADKYKLKKMFTVDPTVKEFMQASGLFDKVKQRSGL